MTPNRLASCRSGHQSPHRAFLLAKHPAWCMAESPKNNEGFSGAERLDDLSPRQKQEIRQQSRPNAALIHETIRAEGLDELERAPRALACSGLAAGLSMGFSLIVQGILRAHLPAGPLRELLTPL